MLELTVGDGLDFFSAQGRIKDKLELLNLLTSGSATSTSARRPLRSPAA
ncbi:MAG: hypothetical protein R2882_08705 [Gemmatimonadales bacterium]